MRGDDVPINGYGEADNSHDDDGGDGGGQVEWRIAHEIQRVFGAVAGLSGLDEDPPWVPVAPGEAPKLVAAYRQARECADQLAAALETAGIDPGEVPGLCASLDAAGRPVVALGKISAGTAERITAALRGLPDPPAGRDRAA
jgi:hypothetical protein